MFNTIAEDITVSFPAIDITGTLTHDPDQHALILTDTFGEREVLSKSFDAYGLHAQPDTVFLKDWSEHEGLTQSLVDAGVVEIVRSFNVGPFSSKAFEVRIRSVAATPVLVGA